MPHFDLKRMLENISYEPQLNLLAQITKDEKENGAFVDRRRFLINDQWYIMVDSSRAKLVIGYDYNYIFIKETGYFQRWGKTIDDDPLYSPIGPEILDIEISINGCPKIKGENCKFCYKNNTNAPATNMTLETFKTIINKIPRTLTQVAFGITGIQTNPDFIPMMEYCREIGIVPNFTLSGADLTDAIAEKVAKISGALAVSAYESDKNVCYNAIKKFTSLGMDQVNIHLMVSQETLKFVYEVLEDRMNDERLKDMHAIVFLGVKPKGRAAGHFHSLTKTQYAELVKYCLDKGFNFGFDSCSAPKFEAAVKGMDLPKEVSKKFIEASESCESDIFSSYINVYGEYWHCSFTEGEPNKECVDVLAIDDFLKELWYSDTVSNFRNELISGMIDGCRKCPTFPVINE